MSDQTTFSLKRVVISTVTLIAAFILTKFLLQVLIFQTCRSLGYHPIFNFSYIHATDDVFAKWSRSRVIAVDFFPPLLCLILGAGLYRAMYIQTRSWGYLQFFGYWLMVCLINIFFAQLLFAPLGVDDPASAFYQTMAVVEAWCHLPVSIASVGAMIGIIASAAVGYFLSIETVKLSHSQRHVVENRGKNIVVIQSFVLPLILASVPLLLLGRGLYTLPLAVALISLLLYPLGMFLRNSRGPYRVRFQKTEVPPTFVLIALLITGVIWTVVYVRYR